MKTLPGVELEPMRKKGVAYIANCLKHLRSARSEEIIAHHYGGSLHMISTLHGLGLLRLDELSRLTDLALSAVSYARRDVRYA